MGSRKFFFGVLAGTAVFVYLIGSFLVATLDITLWRDGHRFFAVVVYLTIVWSYFQSLVKPDKDSEMKEEEQIRSVVPENG